MDKAVFFTKKYPIIMGISSPQYTPEQLEAMREANEKGITIIPAMKLRSIRGRLSGRYASRSGEY